MAVATYWERGESIDYLNTGTDLIKFGDVVELGTGHVGVAGCDIGVGETGSLHVIGAYWLPSGGAAFAVGDEAFWDAAAGQVVASGTTSAGWVIKAATASDITVLVKIGG